MNVKEGITGFDLKLFAMLTMLIDHIGAVFYPDIVWLRLIGRLSFPIFAFMIAEGYFYTKNSKKYMLRLLLFAFIAEIPFDFAFFGTIWYPAHNNVLFTFFLALLSLYIIDKSKVFKSDCTLNLLERIIILFSLITILAFALYLGIDYDILGILIVITFYLARNNAKLKFALVIVYNIAYALLGVSYAGFSLNNISQALAGLSILLILLYNEKRGRDLKYLFYVFYPAHLLIIGIIHYYF